MAGALTRIADALEKATTPERESPYENPHSGRQRDRLGRQVPRRIPFATWLEAGIRLDGSKPSDRVRLVPRSAITEHGHDEDGSAYALIVCPCGQKPVARLESPVKCAGCERHYYGGGWNGRVFVIYGDMTAPQAETGLTEASSP